MGQSYDGHQRQLRVAQRRSFFTGTEYALGDHIIVTYVLLVILGIFLEGEDTDSFA